MGKLGVEVIIKPLINTLLLALKGHNSITLLLKAAQGTIPACQFC